MAVTEEILVNVTPQETRVAVVEQVVTQEVHIERGSSRGLVGNIYMGRVSRVLPGMQSAFIDIGGERAAFLHVADIRRYVETGEPLGKAGAYAIQGRAGAFVTRIAGSYSGIVGLPLVETAELLKKFNIPLW